jgi:KipI family sensor histidine kinase inhibitor
MTADLKPTLLPLGDRALLVRYADTLSDAANRAAVALGHSLMLDPIPGVAEIAPGLASVLLRREEGADLRAIRGEVMLRLGAPLPEVAAQERVVEILFDGEDVAEVAAALKLSRGGFEERHNAHPLRVLATGFAPGFVYCGFHEADLVLPRREAVRPMVPAGTVLFAAGQTAIAATPIRTGWHVIGRTTFQNFDPQRTPATILAAGDTVQFRSAV